MDVPGESCLRGGLALQPPRPLSWALPLGWSFGSLLGAARHCGSRRSKLA
jgi:hypothetical protein